MIEPFETDDPRDRRLALGLSGVLGRFNAAGVIEAADAHTARRIQSLARRARRRRRRLRARAGRALAAPRVGVPRPAPSSPPSRCPAGLAWPGSGWIDRGRGKPARARPACCASRAAVAYLDRYWREECQVATTSSRGSPSPAGGRRCSARGAGAGAVPAGVRRAARGRGGGGPAVDDRADRRSRHRQDHRGRGPAGAARRPVRRGRCGSRSGARPARRRPGSRRPCARRSAEPRSPGTPRRSVTDRADAPPAPRLEARQPQPVPPRSSQPAAPRRDRRRRDLDGVADDDGSAGRGRAVRLPAGARRRPRPARVGGGRRGARPTSSKAWPGATPITVSSLATSHRFGREINDLAEAVRDGDADRALDLLAAGGELTSSSSTPTTPPRSRRSASAWSPTRCDCATRPRCRRRPGAVGVLDEHRLLCAHRDGPWGVGHWNRAVERGLAEHTGLPIGGGWGQEWYAGRPLLLTSNDYGLELFNGDTGVVVADGDGVRAAIATPRGPRLLPPRGSPTSRRCTR